MFSVSHTNTIASSLLTSASESILSFFNILKAVLVTPAILLSASISQHGSGRKVSPASGQDCSNDLQIQCPPHKIIPMVRLPLNATP